MANAATTNLALIKPEVGADADAWGGHWNTNADSLDAMLAGVLYGLTLSTAGSSATFGIAAGAASGMALASAYTKTTSSWAVGTGNGGLDTGAIANSTWYHVFLIQRVDTGVVDIVFSATATPASGPTTLPTNYTRYRRIGSMKTNGSAQWTAFYQNGDDFYWGAGVSEFNGTIATGPQTITLTVPTGVSIKANIAGIYGSGAGQALVFYSPLQTALTPSSLGTLTCYTQAAATFWNASVLTNTSAQINYNGDTIALLRISTLGWTDTRGKG